MRLPKWLGDKIVEYQGDLEYEYQTLCSQLVLHCCVCFSQHDTYF